MIRVRFLALLLAFGPDDLTAFGPLGHQLIADLAEERLSPPARAELRRLLGDAPDLAAVSTWADALREADPERGRKTAPWHYVNLPRAAGCRYEPRRDCPEGQCVVAALTAQVTALADRRAPRESRREALFWVVHLVGDIHQPLHAGYPDDRGGNLFQVHYLGRGSNLHALWDSGLIESRRLERAAYLAELRARAPETAKRRVRWSRAAPRRWAEESCALIESLGIYPRRPGRLPREYLERMRPYAEERLVLAGLRLASLLEAALGGDGASPPRRPDPAAPHSTRTPKP